MRQESPSPAGAHDSAFDELLREVARTPEAHVKPGEAFGGGRYVVQRPLGVGGQKNVLLVRDTSLDRDCALSVVRSAGVSEQDLDRFRLEARALARFGAHPNIVTIYDLGEERGLPYALCEYLEGGDVREVLDQRGALPPERALAIARDVSRALSFAHERGVVHRDLKPENIWLLGDGTAKLGDFGLALVSGQGRLTSADTVLGTPHYMAPEQARGQPLDVRSDLYSLGCVLYELLTGEPPFDGMSAIAIVSQHVHADPVALRDRAPGIDQAIDRLVMELLSKDPDRRPQRAADLVTRLERLLSAGDRATARAAPIPANEPDRLAALHALGILDTPPEVAYDEIAELAAQLCGCPIGYICFIDEARQWMKARAGVPPELASAPREVGVCQTTICQSDVLVAPDLSRDERFRDLPPVAGPPGFRFYAGAPLITRQGYALGTLVVMDFEPREASFEQIESIRRLARQAMAQIELREKAAELDRSVEELARARRSAEDARQRADELLHNILPAPIAAELEAKRKVEPRYHDSVTVGVVELRGFDRRAASLEPARLVRTLDEFFCAFDGIAQARNLEKIKTIGGTYLLAGGLLGARRSHPIDACLAALELRRAARRIDEQRARARLEPWGLAIALHSGPAMSGVVGTWKLSYDVWGETVTIAQRIAVTVAEDDVVLSASTHQRVKDLFDCRPCGELEVADRPSVGLFAIERIREDLSGDPEGQSPNAAFHARAAQLFSDYTPRREN